VFTNVFEEHTASSFRAEVSPIRKGDGYIGKVMEQATENWRFKFTLKMEAICSSKMLVMTYHTMQCHNLEDHNINLYCHGNHNQDNI
jgi:hypothetical protein